MSRNFFSIRIEELGRIPEPLRALSGVQGEFWTMAEDRLTQALVSTKLNQLIHLQVVNALVALARVAATYEDFVLVRSVGVALEESGARDPAAHGPCCCSAPPLLLLPSAVDRMTEIFLEKRNDSTWVKTAARTSALEKRVILYLAKFEDKQHAIASGLIFNSLEMVARDGSQSKYTPSADLAFALSRTLPKRCHQGRRDSNSRPLP